jgi:hypothetical protein
MGSPTSSFLCQWPAQWYDTQLLTGTCGYFTVTAKATDSTFDYVSATTWVQICRDYGVPGQVSSMSFHGNSD